MYNPDTELIFPTRVIPTLRDLRSQEWHELVERVYRSGTETTDQLAFVLMMVRMDGCVSCNTHSFRAMRGCTQCAQQAVRRYRGTDKELVEQFEQARLEVDEWFINRKDYDSLINMEEI